MPPQTVNPNVLVLLIEDNPVSMGPIREALAHLKGWCRLQCVGSIPTGIARVAGGGVSLVLLDLSLLRGEGDDILSHFHQLYGEARGVPIVVLCRAEEEGLALSSVRAGAADYMIKDRCATDLERLLQSVVERHRRPLDSTHMETSLAQKAGTLITVLGAKGGVGTTTVALNVGSVLARRKRAIVTEFRSTLGTLLPFFRAQNRTRNITSLLSMEPAAITEAQAVSCLWPYRAIPGLSLLFGPQTLEPCREPGPAHTKIILEMLTKLADYVVVDLPASLSETNRAVIQESNLLAMVVDNDPICLQSAKLILETIESWNAVPQIGAVIVNRLSLSSSMPASEIETQLGLPIFGVIPPASDLCLAAQKVHTPLVAFQVESLVGGSFTALAERLANPA